jgi:hypothetical protein
MMGAAMSVDRSAVDIAETMDSQNKMARNAGIIAEKRRAPGP